MSHKQTEEEAQRAFTHGSSGATADAAVDASKDGVRPLEEQKHVDQPHARESDTPLTQGVKHDQLADKEAEAGDRQEALLDEAIEETFPSSDPISPKQIT